MRSRREKSPGDTPRNQLHWSQSTTTPRAFGADTTPNATTPTPLRGPPRYSVIAPEMVNGGGYDGAVGERQDGATPNKSGGRVTVLPWL